MWDVSHDRPLGFAPLRHCWASGSPTDHQSLPAHLLPGVIQVPLERVAVGGRPAGLTNPGLSCRLWCASLERVQLGLVGTVLDEWPADVGKRSGIG